MGQVQKKADKGENKGDICLCLEKLRWDTGSQGSRIGRTLGNFGL